ncbi:MAG: pyridoxine 5'-phosphate synthase [Polyangiaceae bacterium]|jgi:pyridoxine 5-phosphate synthase
MTDPPVRLHINIDHVATLRNARGTSYPDPVRAAEACLAAGADGITAHLREDRRHIVDDDIERLRATVARARRTFNLEMAATDELVAIAMKIRPEACTLVPERRQERTTEGGLDVVAGGRDLARRVRTLIDAGLRVSLFIAADLSHIEASRNLGVAQIELHTGEYAHGCHGELARLAAGAERAHALGIAVAAGHGLTQDLVPDLVASGPIEELNIGHAVVSDALFVGLGPTVERYKERIARGLAARRAT